MLTQTFRTKEDCVCGFCSKYDLVRHNNNSSNNTTTDEDHAVYDVYDDVYDGVKVRSAFLLVTQGVNRTFFLFLLLFRSCEMLYLCVL